MTVAELIYALQHMPEGALDMQVAYEEEGIFRDVAEPHVTTMRDDATEARPGESGTKIVSLS